MTEDGVRKTNEGSGFTLSMAFMDMLPVIFFSVSIAVLSSRFSSFLFLLGAILVILAGGLKVLWKFILAIMKRDVRILNRQMRFLMPGGFIVMVLALIVNRDGWSVTAVIGHILSFPAILFFLLAAAGIACMIYFAGHLDGMDPKSNWIEQGTNSLAQFFFMMGIIF